LYNVHEINSNVHEINSNMCNMFSKYKVKKENSQLGLKSNKGLL